MIWTSDELLLLADAYDKHGDYVFGLANIVTTKTINQIKKKVQNYKYKRVKVAKSLRLLA